MSQHTKTFTFRCPKAFPFRLEGYKEEMMPCGADIEVEITFGWDPGQDGGTTDPSWSAHVEDVEVPAITCHDCGHEFTEAEREAVAKEAEDLLNRDDYRGEYDGPDTVEERDDWADPRFNWDINGRCAP